VAILVAAVVLGGFYFASQAQKQSALERQHSAELQLERKQDCFELYKIEKDNNENVIRWSYNDVMDWCEIDYMQSNGESTKRLF